MPTSVSDEGFVTLRGGLTVPVEPFLLLLDLESRGLHLAAEGGTLTVGPQRDLTADDCRRIKEWKTHLLALLAYEPPEVQ